MNVDCTCRGPYAEVTPAGCGYCPGALGQYSRDTVRVTVALEEPRSRFEEKAGKEIFGENSAILETAIPTCPVLLY